LDKKKRLPRRGRGPETIGLRAGMEDRPDGLAAETGIAEAKGALLEDR